MFRAQTEIDQTQDAMHSRLAGTRQSVAPDGISEILCNRDGGRLVNPININLLFIAPRSAPVVWERLLLHDRVIEHRFVGGEESRQREIDGRCQSKLCGKPHDCWNDE